MTLQKIKIRPGFNTQLSQTANESGWFNGNLVRWKLGLLEKVGGWQQLVATACLGFVRYLHGWEDLQGNSDLLIGTDAGPQIFVLGMLDTFDLAGAAGDSFPTNPSAGSIQVGSGIAAIGTTGNTTITIQTNNLSVVSGEVLTTKIFCTLGGVPIPVNSLFTVTSTSAVNATTNSYTFNLATAAVTTLISTTPQALMFLNGPSGSLGPNAVSFPAVNVQIVSHGLSNGSTFTFDVATNINYTKNFGSLTVAFNLDIPAGATSTVGVFDSSNFTFSAASFVTGTWGVKNFTLTIDEGETYTSIQNATTSSYTVAQLSLFQAVNPFVPIGVSTWFLDNLGTNGLLVYSVSPIYVYTPPIANGMVLMNAGAGTPQNNTGMFVAMPQAQVIVFGTEPIIGSGQIDPLLLRFSDAGGYTIWNATVSNQAGSYRLSRGSKIVGGLQAPQTTLIWTDIDVWSMSYIGPPLVYGFTIMGEGCGLIAPHAAATLGRTTYWQGQNSFWMFGDMGVQALPCPVWDQIFANLNQPLIDLCFAGANSSFHEVWFFYPSLNVPNEIASPNNLGSASWAPFFCSITTGLTDPFGGTTAAKIVEDTSTNIHSVIQTTSIPIGPISLQYNVYVKSTSTRHLNITIFDETTNNGAGAYVNPINGTIIGPRTFGTGFFAPMVTLTTNSIATGPTGNGWYLVNVSTTIESTTPGDVMFSLNPAEGVFGDNYTGNGTSFVEVAMPSMFYAMCDSYVKYNAVENLWDFGSLYRSSWMDNSVFGTPLAGDLSNLVQQHEQGYDNNSTPMTGVFAETGYAEVAEGDQIMYIDNVVPDLKWFGNTTAASVNLTMYGTEYPGSITTTNPIGPFALTPTTQFQTFRLRARQVAMRLDWGNATGFTARVEAMRFRMAPSGKRP